MKCNHKLSFNVLIFLNCLFQWLIWTFFWFYDIDHMLNMHLNRFLENTSTCKHMWFFLQN
jgi:hypothetical protein